MQPIENPFTDADALLDEARRRAAAADPPGRLPLRADVARRTRSGSTSTGGSARSSGTHTHVVTGDERILPKGTAYLTDLGMTGPVWSVIGFDPRRSCRASSTRCRRGSRSATGPVVFNASRSTSTRRPVARSRSSGSSAWSTRESGRPATRNEPAAAGRRPPAADRRLTTPTRRAPTASSSRPSSSRVAEAGVRTLAITDHDSLAGYREVTAARCLPDGARLIPGVEINARDPRPRRAGGRAAHPRASAWTRTTRRSSGAPAAARCAPGCASRRPSSASASSGCRSTRRSRRST